jgi:hypothetical protein
MLNVDGSKLPPYNKKKPQPIVRKQIAGFCEEASSSGQMAVPLPA